MEFDRSRLRPGEWIVGAGSLVLLASTFLLNWYALSGPLARTASKFLGLSTSVNGWHALSSLRWLIVLTGLAGLGVFYIQASRRAPALPVSSTMIVTVLGLLTSIALFYRVVIDEPGGYSDIQLRFGAFAGLLSAIAIVVGGYRSLREDGIAPADGPAEIETVKLGN
ncbi:MAG: hypothetical protein M3Z06_05515 [Actinomycetota bacterium]|nr:hypothetical protein [Actinomycetota bacterium]